MKKLFHFTIFTCLAVILGACAQGSPQPGNAMINPGDQVGDFLITTGKEGEVTYSWDLDCVKQGDEDNYLCKTSVGTNVNVSIGIFDDQYTGKLDEYWSGHTYELFIEDRPVNLQAFGYIDVTHPLVGPMRHWNVVIVAAKAGEIKLHDSGVVDGTPFKSTTTYSFSAP